MSMRRRYAERDMFGRLSHCEHLVLRSRLAILAMLTGGYEAEQRSVNRLLADLGEVALFRERENEKRKTE